MHRQAKPVRLFLLLPWVLCTLAARSPGQPASTSSAPELLNTIEALVATLSAGEPQRWEQFARERFAPEALSRRTPEQRRQLLARLHEDFGTMRLTGIRPQDDPWAADVEVRSSAGTIAGTLHVELEPAPPHRIRQFGISVDQGGDGRPKTSLPPPPDLRGAKDPQRLSSLLDPYLEKLAADDTLSGVVLVAHAGKPLFERAYGLADRERKAPNTTDTRFNVGSIGKQFTRVAIGQLLAAGKLALDDPLARHLPGYPNHDAARKITIRQLLEHRAGVVDIFDVIHAGDPPPRSNHEWFLRVAPLPLQFPPGTQKRYCNGCYVVLGEVVAALSGTTYEDYLASHVFAPAGMSAAFLAGSDPEERKARGYTRTPAGLEVASLGPGGRGCGAGGVFATGRDLLAYDNALREYRLLDRERTAWMLDGADSTGSRAGGASTVAGGAPGVNAVLASEGEWTVIVLTNHDPRAGEDLGIALARAILR